AGPTGSRTTTAQVVHEVPRTVVGASVAVTTASPSWGARSCCSWGVSSRVVVPPPCESRRPRGRAGIPGRPGRCPTRRESFPGPEPCDGSSLGTAEGGLPVRKVIAASCGVGALLLAVGAALGTAAVGWSFGDAVEAFV